MEPQQYEQRGYLREDFRLFHLADSDRPEIAYHYHTFHKIILLLAGRAGYCVEGERYELAPGDLVVIGRGSIHRPELRQGRLLRADDPLHLARISREKTARRTAISPRASSRRRAGFSTSTAQARTTRSAPCSPRWSRPGARRNSARRCCNGPSRCSCSSSSTARCSRATPSPAAAGDSKIVAILQYLNLHLTEPITIDELAGRFYLSKYHMMRRFRQETGYTIHHYLMEKRLMLAQQLLRTGAPLAQVCFDVGYQDYSTLLPRVQNHFGRAPSADTQR